MPETSAREAVIVDAIRTPIGRGKPGGLLADIHPVDLLAQTLQQLVSRSDLDPGTVDDVLIGCVSQVSEQSATPGRMAWLGAGFPEHVPAVTIDRKCGSSQQAVSFAAQAIMSGTADIVVAGGVESMSRVPMGSARAGADPYGELVGERYSPGLTSQGVGAELVAAKYGLTREQLDEYSVRSHQLAAATDFSREIVPVRNGNEVITADNTVRPDSSVEKLGQLNTVFKTDELAARFPQINWSVTAGNSSQITDGASALLVMSAAKAEQLGLTPRARIHSFTAVGDDPLLMLTGPIPATHKLLERTGFDLGQIDHVEVNEAFAPVPLAWMQEFDVDPAKVNPRGGAIALGHPLGASGARLMTTMLHALEDTGGRYGLQLMCEAGGMANATIIERL
ncbi:thiolase family protein [Gulosibacter chungangensis]|uniref:Thiolase family protein n=1 Tax=Gulosibacter chungangensis TaxID=979746 RepID=A0A7J5BFW5_9MICO|nr:thiolase family protein [Gulosibacter chungangensis]KAB1645124.1 thiolase family protein [Gulosibacter chungangensis]